MAEIVHTEGESNTSQARKSWSETATGPRAAPLLARDSNAFLHQSLSSPCVSTIAKAEGIWIEDVDGRKYMDFHGNSVHHIGYGHPRLIAAIKKQLDDLPFAPRRFTNDPAVELAEKLGDIAPGDLNKVLFTTGGSDANEVALKSLAPPLDASRRLASGTVFMALALARPVSAARPRFAATSRVHCCPALNTSRPSPVIAAPTITPDRMSAAWPVLKWSTSFLNAKAMFAAVIAEPMRAVPYVPPPGFWKAVREACNRRGALLIMDEIPTGLGKTGRMFAFQHDEIIPDIVTLGKALGGGILPISAVVARRDLDVCGDYAIGHYTHEKNPVTSRAALTTIHIIEDENLVERSAELGAFAMDYLENQIGTHPNVGDIRGRGLMFGVEIVEDKSDKSPGLQRAEQIYYACLSAGLSFKISLGCVLTLSPPLTIEKPDLIKALDIVIQAIKTS